MLVARPSEPPATSGDVYVDSRTPSCLRTWLVGHLDVRLAVRFIALVDEWAANRTSLVAFHDCSRLDDYDVEARERISAWARVRVRQFDAVHLLVHGRTIAWGLQVISTIVGPKLIAHYERASFEAASDRCRGSASGARR
jgi:hypothetical protein